MTQRAANQVATNESQRQENLRAYHQKVREREFQAKRIARMKELQRSQKAEDFENDRACFEECEMLKDLMKQHRVSLADSTARGDLRHDPSLLRGVRDAEGPDEAAPSVL